MNNPDGAQALPSSLPTPLRLTPALIAALLSQESTDPRLTWEQGKRMEVLGAAWQVQALAEFLDQHWPTGARRVQIIGPISGLSTDLEVQVEQEQGDRTADAVLARQLISFFPRYENGELVESVATQWLHAWFWNRGTPRGVERAQLGEWVEAFLPADVCAQVKAFQASAKLQERLPLAPPCAVSAPRF